jgi:hypothetical protein
MFPSEDINEMTCQGLMSPEAFVVASSNLEPQTYVKPEDAITAFELVMTRGLLLETC